MERPYPACNGSEPYVFVSYAHRDEQVVFEEIALLQELGHAIWYDEGILPTTIWRDEIANFLGSAALFLIYVSEHSQSSKYCLQEVNFALSRGVPVLPILLSEMEFAPGLDLSLGNRQALARYKYAPEAYRERLAASIDALLPDDHAAIATHVDRDVGGPENRQVSIAVLPLTTRGDSEESALLADGVTDELIFGLSRVPNLVVTPRTSSYYYRDRDTQPKEIGRELGVDTVLEGHLVRAGDRVRVTVELVNTRDGFTFWSERYTVTMADIFDVQEDIARQVLDSLRISLSTSERIALLDVGTRDALAYELCLKARHERSRELASSLEQALVHVAHAVEEDPEFIEAYYECFLVHQSRRRLYGVPWSEVGPQVQSLLATMRRLDPLCERIDWKEIEEFIRSRGLIDMRGYERTSRQALQRSDERRGMPRHAYYVYGEILSLSDLPQEAIGYYRRFELRNPKDTVVKYSLAYNYTHIGDLEAALESCNQALQIDSGSIRLHGTRVCVLSRLGRAAEAHRDLTFLQKVWGSTNFATFYHAFWCEGPEAAAVQLDWLAERKIPNAFKGYGKLVLGDIDAAVDYFRLDLEAEASFLINLNRFARFYAPEEQWRNACAHQGFQALRERLGIGDAWRDELLGFVDELAETTGVGRASD